MVAIPVYDVTGTKVREVELDPARVDSLVRKPLLKEALIAFLASQRQGTHKVKRRCEVAGGNKKPWRQKGTGRARHGSTRSPMWVKGGVANGPQPRDYHYRLPAAQRRLAVRSSLRYRLEQGRILAVEGLEGGLEAPKTRKVAKFLGAIGLEGKGILVIQESLDRNLLLSIRNIQKLDLLDRRSLNAGVILQRPNLVFTAQALDGLVKELSA